MKKLPLLLIAFLFMTMSAMATTIQMTNPNIATIVIPDGSTITSAVFEPPGSTLTGRWLVTFTFADGFGNEWDDYNDGGQGSIFFNSPVTHLSINWFTTGTFQTFNGFTSCRSQFGCPNEGTAEFDGPISGLSWSIFTGGYGGISSMSYTAPEPTSLALLPLGLVAIGVLRRTGFRSMSRMGWRG